MQHQQKLSQATDPGSGLLVLGMLVFGLIAFFVLFGGGQNAGGGLVIVLLLACPIMHLFMHRGHRGH